jgi:hypothetical protein
VQEFSKKVPALNLKLSIFKLCAKATLRLTHGFSTVPHFPLEDLSGPIIIVSSELKVPNEISNKNNKNKTLIIRTTIYIQNF